MDRYQIFYGIIAFISGIIILIGRYKIFKKAKLNGRGALIPFYSDYLWFKLAGKKSWFWFIIIPPIFQFLKILSNFHIAKKFKKNDVFAFAMNLFPVIFIPILGFWKSKYDSGKKHSWKYYNIFLVTIFLIFLSFIGTLLFAGFNPGKLPKVDNLNEKIITKAKKFTDYFYHPILGWIDEHDYFEDDKGTISWKELEPHLKDLQKGDIMLSYTPSYPTSLVIPGEWTHAFVYLGDGEIIDASGKGVTKRELSEVSNLSRGSLLTGLVAFRPNFSDEEFEKFIKFLEEKIGMPYDYGFTGDEDSYYCSGLIGDALESLGYEIPGKIPADKIFDNYKPITAPQTLFDYFQDYGIPEGNFKEVLFIKKEGFSEDLDI